MTNSGLGSEDADSEHAFVESVLEEVVRKVESGAYSPQVFIDKAFKLAEMGQAHQYMEENRAVGKVVVTVP